MVRRESQQSCQVASDDADATCELLHLNYLPPSITSIQDVGDVSWDQILLNINNQFSPVPWINNECVWFNAGAGANGRWVLRTDETLPCYNNVRPRGCVWNDAVGWLTENDGLRCDSADRLWTNVPTEGTTIVVRGSNFGKYGSININGFCLENLSEENEITEIWMKNKDDYFTRLFKKTTCLTADVPASSLYMKWSEDHSFVLIRIPILTGSNYKLGIVVEGQVPLDCGEAMTCDEMLTLNARKPTIRSIELERGIMEATTKGGYNIIIQGEDFGTNWVPIEVLIDTSSASKVLERTCQIKNHTHTEIICIVPAGEGKHLPTKVMLGKW